MTDNRSAIATAIKQLGSPQPVSRQPKKETLMSFRDGGIYVALKLVSLFDKETQEYQKPVPKITFLIDGKYARIPVNSNWLKKFGEFITGLSEVIDGTDTEKYGDKKVDIEAVKKKLDPFRSVQNVQ